MDWTMSPRSRPKPLVAFPWGSRSTTRTASPARARYVARLTTVVVLPTPPFWLAQAMIWPTQVPISVVDTLVFYHPGPIQRLVWPVHPDPSGRVWGTSTGFWIPYQRGIDRRLSRDCGSDSGARSEVVGSRRPPGNETAGGGDDVL